MALLFYIKKYIHKGTGNVANIRQNMCEMRSKFVSKKNGGQNLQVRRDGHLLHEQVFMVAS